MLVGGLAVLALCLPAGVAVAAPGDLDPTFGNGGKALIDLGGSEEPSDLLAQSDGKVIVTGSSGGNLIAARVLVPQGTLDPSYGGGLGFSSADLGGTERYGAGALQPDGKIILAGTTYFVDDDYGIARLLNPQGTFDSGFSGNGIEVAGGAGSEGATAVTLQPDGRIVFAGFEGSGPAGQDWLVGRLLNPQGSPDSSFGTGGFVTLNMSGTADIAYDVLVQPDGKVLVAGQGGRDEGQGGGFGVIARRLPGGNSDDGFANSGDRRGLGLSVFDMALQPDGKIVAAGYDGSFQVSRLLPSGALDESFGGDGTTGTADFDLASAIIVQPDGKVIAAGGAGPGIGVARFQPNGLLDSTFGNNGKVTLDFGVEFGMGGGAGLVLQPDGKIILAGNVLGNIALARLDGDPPGDVAGKCRGKKATIVGTNGKEKLKGTNKKDVVSAGGGKDTVKGLKGNDLICGGKGPDKLIGGPGKDTMLGEKGKDKLFGGPKKDKLLGGAAKDLIVGGGGPDKINGGPGEDTERQ